MTGVQTCALPISLTSSFFLSSFVADFDWATLLDIVRKNKIVNKEVSRYPAVRRDLSMLIDKNVTFDTLKTIAFKTEKDLFLPPGT